MKAKIHPKYYKNATITCACGNVFEVGSTVEKIEIEICSNCHPFYTGKKKLVDSAGQVDRFQKKMEAAEKFKKAQADKNKKKQAKKKSKSSAEKTTASKKKTTKK
jgi:large subunit ribosomal protein L31